MDKVGIRVPIYRTLVPRRRRSARPDPAAWGASRRAMMVTDRSHACGVVQWHGLIDQHDGDVIADLVEQPAGFTDEPIAVLREADIPLAFWAGQDGEQFLVD